ncbi:MAG: ABC transporter substrate-binding protein [Proteobacteria bacterium]|nr:ABC transporter substrate-binding protein [Pseudomonadota bacterium]MBU1687564.1 ABC transporter substrate-binding protein [Pseudomonadota bacterium]
MTMINFIKNTFPNRFLFFLCLFLLISFSYSSSLGAKSNALSPQLDPVTLQLKWFHQFQFAGYYAALEKGFYKEVGLDVTIKEGQSGMDFIEEVVSGRAHYGIEMPELLIARNMGKPVVVLAAIFQHSPQIILVRADSDIKSPHNLIGKKVMWRFDSAAELQAMLIKEGVSLDQINFWELSWDINDLIDGKVDAIHAYVTAQPFILEQAGVESTVISPINYGIDFYGDCLFTSENELGGHPERVKVFREASLRGWDYAMKHPEELMDLIKGKYHTKRTLEFMQHEFEHLNQLMLPKLVEIGHMNPGRWKHIGDTFVKLGMLSQDYSLDGFIYDPVPQPDNTKDIRIIWLLLSVISLITISAIILFVFNRKLKTKVLSRTKHLTAEIAERKQAEDALRENQIIFQAFLENSPVYIFFKDHEIRSLMLSKNYEQLLGMPLESILGRTMDDLFPSDLAKSMIEADKQILRKGKNITVVEEFDGRTYETTKFLISLDNKPNMLAGFTLDITDRKKAEEEKDILQAQLLHTQKMEAIGTLSGGIAHDFNNILAAILGYADMAKDDIPDWSPAKHQIEEVLKAGNRAKELVKQILAFSRKAEHKRVPVQFDSVIKEVLNFLRASIPTTIDIKLNIASSCGNTLADPTQLHQVLMNLCTNAAQAMEEDGGVLSINLSTVDIKNDAFDAKSTLKPGPYILLVVSDTGVGIEKEHLARIFDPYFTTKEFGKGSGMGLAVVHGIINNHGGMITVESSLGQGTTFKTYFPKIEEETEDLEVSETSPYPGGNEKILIVDDDVSLATLTQKRLEMLGYKTTAMTSSTEALELFRAESNDYNLVITDQTMPTMTGEQLAKELLNLRPDIPIIMCTGYSSKIDADKANSIGIRAFIIKPVDTKELSRMVRKVLDSN